MSTPRFPALGSCSVVNARAYCPLCDPPCGSLLRGRTARLGSASSCCRDTQAVCALLYSIRVFMSVYAVFFFIMLVLAIQFAEGVGMGGSFNTAESRILEVYETLVALWGVPCLFWGDSKPHWLTFWWEFKTSPSSPFHLFLSQMNMLLMVYTQGLVTVAALVSSSGWVLLKAGTQVWSHVKSSFKVRLYNCEEGGQR